MVLFLREIRDFGDLELIGKMISSVNSLSSFELSLFRLTFLS